VRKGEKVAVVLSGGNARIAKADRDAPVQAYIAGMPGWKRDLGMRLDALIVRNVPNVRKAVKWNTPFYGIEGCGIGSWGFLGWPASESGRLRYGDGGRPPPQGAS
jgi:hypothetical protein